MAMTPFFGRDPFWGISGPLSTFDEFSSLLDAPSSAFVRETQAVANTAVDVKETPDKFVFTADMPGLRKEEVKVQVEDGNVLCISGERTREKTEESDRFHRMERSMGRFQRRFRLPETTKFEHIKANVENGVLTVSVPKEPPPPEQKKETKSITIE